MPALSKFQDFDLEDDIALERFLDANDRRHKIYGKRTGTPGGTLDGPVNGDWFLRETRRHIMLATLTSKPLSSADTKVLLLTRKWLTQQELADWMDLHARLHFHIERVLKIY
jgi:hypothetical protein